MRVRSSVIVLAVAACQTTSAPAPQPAPVPAPRPIVAIDAAPPPPPPPSPSRGVVSVGMGWGCARTSDAKLACWGRSYGDRAAIVPGIEHVAGVATGQAVMCAWTTAGTVFCGDRPTALPGLDDVVQVAADPDAEVFCARRKTGAVSCWRDLAKADAPKPVPIEGAEEIAVAGMTVCARRGGDVVCANPNEHDTRRIDAASGATRIAGGYYHFVALRAGQPPASWDEFGKPAKVPAFDSDVAQIAMGSGDVCARGARMVCWHKDGGPEVIANAAGARDLAVGWSVACAAVGAELRCWGAIGSLGNGVAFTSDAPVAVAGLTDAVQIDAGGERTCARRATGQTLCWGSRKDGGHDAIPVDDGTKLELRRSRSWEGSNGRGAWSCGTKSHHVTCKQTFYGRHGDTETGPWDSWGDLDDVRDLRMPNNESDLLCIASATGAVSCLSAWNTRDTEVVVDGVTDATQLVPYGEATCALERAGTVKCWNERDREYNGGKVATIAGITDAVELASGDVHVCARHKSGAVSCWGVRTMLGDGADTHQTDAVTLPVSL